MYALGRLKAGVMNKTEAAYSQVLEAKQLAGEILWWSFEGITFKLADGCRYTPDFAVLAADGELQMHEVKGYFMDDAKVKVKVAAEKFPCRFLIIRAIPKKDGGGWSTEDYSS